MTPCPSCGLNLKNYPHSPGSQCWEIWQSVLLEHFNKLAYSVDNGPNVADGYSPFPDFSSLQTRFLAAELKVSTLRKIEVLYQKTVNSINLGTLSRPDEIAPNDPNAPRIDQVDENSETGSDEDDETMGQ